MDFNSCLCCWKLQKDIDVNESRMGQRRLHNKQFHEHGSETQWKVLGDYWTMTRLLRLYCRNPSLGLATKARGYKVAGQEGNMGVMPHAPRSARECEGIDPHTPKGIPPLGVGVLMDSRMFRERLQGSKPNVLKKNYIIRKLLKFRCLKWACMTHLDICNTSYGQKKGQESNGQFDSRPLKVGNRPDFLECKWRAT